MYGETNPERDTWVETQLGQLLASHGKTVIRQLEKHRQGIAPNGAAGRALRQVLSEWPGKLRRGLVRPRLSAGHS